MPAADPFEDPIRELAHAARIDQAAEARRQRALWERLGSEEATMATVLEARALAGSAVTAHRDRGAHHGSVVELGPDHVRLAARDRWCALRYSAIEWLEVAGPHEGPPPVRVEISFDELLTRLAGELVVLDLRSGAALVGRLEAVGVGILTLTPDDGPGPSYASSASVVAVRAGAGSG